MANLKDLIVNGAARVIGKTYSSEFVGNVTGNVTGNLTGNVTGDVSGNAGTATKLKTARSLKITDGTHTSAGVDFDGSDAVTLKLPSTIKASITGNVSGSSGSCTGNAATSSKLKTARSLKITDDGTNTSTGVDFDGSNAVTLKLPSTIKASLAGNASTATTASKTAYGISVKDAASNLAVNGWNGSAAGNLTIAGTSPVTTTATANTITVTHDNSGVTAGTYRSVTVDAKGHVTGGANPTTLSGYGITDAYPVSGGIINGHLDIHPTENTVGSFDEGIRIAVGKNGYSDIALGSSPTNTSGSIDGQWWIGCNMKNNGRKLIIAHNGAEASGTYFYADATNDVSPSLRVDGTITGTAGVWGAVFNDLADAIPVGEGDVLEAGYCYGVDGEHYTKTSEYMQKSYIGIHSDTYGFKMGHEEGKEKLNVAVSGFVLAYVDKEYEVGTPLTCTEDGYLTEIELEDKIKYPERIVATYWKSEPNEEWGSEDKKIKVKGRRWVKIK